MEETNVLKAFVLNKLANLRYWGGRHTSINNLPKGCPKHMYGRIKDAIDELIKENFLLTKPKPDSLHVYLNPEKKAEIEQFIRNYFSRKNLKEL